MALSVRAAETPPPSNSPLRNLIARKLKSQPQLNLELFVMSQCPFGVRAEEALIPIIKEFEGKIDFQLHYIVSSDGGGKIQSLHGAAEVAENARQLLIARHFPKQWLDYLHARALNYETDDWQTAASQAGIDVKALALMEQQTRPEALLSFHSQQTQTRNIRLSPSIFIDGERYQGPIQPISPTASNAKSSISVSCTTNADCNDNNLCTTDVCNAGVCTYAPKNCDDNNACTTDACDRGTGNCIHIAKICDDNNACTIDACDPANGSCKNTVINCNDNNPCTVDACDPVNGCTHTLISCNDNNPETGDYCNSQGGCINVPCSSIPPISITSQSSVNPAICLGGTVSFSVNASATGTLSYQWYHNGNALTGISSATTATLSLTNIRTSDAGSYSVSISGICNTSASSAFTLGVPTSASPSSILNLLADESGCPVRLLGQGVGTSFVFTNGQGYVFSNVFRTGGTHDLSGLMVKQPGVYTLTATYTDECGSSSPVSQTVTVGRSCP